MLYCQYKMGGESIKRSPAEKLSDLHSNCIFLLLLLVFFCLFVLGLQASIRFLVEKLFLNDKSAELSQCCASLGTSVFMCYFSTGTISTKGSNCEELVLSCYFTEREVLVKVMLLGKLLQKHTSVLQCVLPMNLYNLHKSTDFKHCAIFWNHLDRHSVKHT